MSTQLIQQLEQLRDVIEYMIEDRPGEYTIEDLAPIETLNEAIAALEGPPAQAKTDDQFREFLRQQKEGPA